MKITSIKAAAATLLLSVTFVAQTSAQNLTSYFMPNAVEGTIHNAAFAPNRGYVNIPVVGAMSLSANGNLSVGDLFIANNGELTSILDTQISSSMALAGLKDVNTFGFENRLSILGFGSYCKDRKSFWTFDISLRSSFNFSLPYELFEFVKTAPDQISINDVNIYMESYVETGIGYSTPINDKITVGGRVKLLVGLANAELNIDRLDLTMNADEWNASAEGTLDLNIDGISPSKTSNSDNVETFELGDIEGTPSGPAGYGAAIDLGATYDFSDRLQFSLAANDIGFIKWNKEANTTATVSNSFSFSGANVEVSNGNANSDTGDDIQLDELEFEAQESANTTKWLQANINAGAEYALLNDRLSVGGIYSIRMWRSKTTHTFTAGSSFTPLNWLSLAASYSIASGSANALGLAANIATGFVNLYVATDILTAKKSAQLVPIDQSMMNFSFGLAIPLGAKGER